MHSPPGGISSGASSATDSQSHKKKSSFCVSLEAVRIALGETQKEEARLRSLPSVITHQLLTFPEMIALQYAN